MTIFLTPLFLLFMQNPKWIPDIFEFVLVRDTVNIPLYFQLLLLELAIDGLRLAALKHSKYAQYSFKCDRRYCHGRIFRQIRLVNSEVMLYMAFVAVAKLYSAKL